MTLSCSAAMRRQRVVVAVKVNVLTRGVLKRLSLSLALIFFCRVCLLISCFLFHVHVHVQVLSMESLREETQDGVTVLEYLRQASITMYHTFSVSPVYFGYIMLFYLYRCV